MVSQHMVIYALLGVACVILLAWGAVMTALYATDDATVRRGRGIAPQPAARPSPGSHVVELTAASFADGSVLITEPGVYHLVEDVEFNPPTDLPTNDQFDANGGPYDRKAFGLGWFAAIVVTACDVEIDLGGHSLSQSRGHQVRQRFFAVIELGSSPFLPNQGPHNFADDASGFQAPCRVEIHSGHLGQSSHHGIHGNLATDVVVRDVTFADFEIAAFHCNGCSRVEVTDVHVQRASTDVPVIGVFSTGFFVRPYADFLSEHGEDVCGSPVTIKLRGETVSATTIANNLNKIVDDTIEAVAAGVKVDPLFASPDGLPDGNNYGMVFHSRGVAVNGFRPVIEEPEVNRDITLRNVVIENIANNVREIVGFGFADDGGKAMQIDAVGAVFQADVVRNDDGSYRRNPVADAQLLVAKYESCFERAADEIIAVFGRPLNTKRSSITPTVLQWAAEGTTALPAPVLRCNADTMAHANRGVLGLRFDAATNVELTDVTIDTVRNLGSFGSAECGQYRAGHSFALATLRGYRGCDARGIGFASSSGVNMERVTVRNVETRFGQSWGVDLFLGTENVAGGVCVQNITSMTVDEIGEDIYGACPMQLPTAVSVASDSLVPSSLGVCVLGVDGELFSDTKLCRQLCSEWIA